uniref:50S ribosomal protein L19 n=2 Tax=Lygus hesperus TaxID=30085 RepID=A0A0A9WXI2_LYGHE
MNLTKTENWNPKMLRQVIDWASNRSTELLTRYKQIASNIGLYDNVNTCESSEIFWEQNRNKRNRGSEEARGRGRRTQRNRSGEPFQPRPQSRKRRRRQARRLEVEHSWGVPNNSACSSNGNRRCSPSVSTSSDCLELGGLRLFFNRRVRLSLTSTIQKNDDPEWENRETYAQIVKTPKVVRDEWLKQLNRQMEVMMTELDKWRSRFRIFSVSVEMTGGSANELGDANRQDFLKQQILVQRLKKALREYFGEISQIDEHVVCQNGTKHRSMYFGPTEQVVENMVSSNESVKKTKQTHAQVQTTMKMNHQRSVVPTDAELEDSCSALEDQFWSKHDHYLKRKSGKASRKRLRMPGPSVDKPSKSEIALVKTECICESRGKKCIVRGTELTYRKLQRRDTAVSDNANYSKRIKCKSPGKESAPQSLPKRLVVMEAKCHRLMKKIEKAKNDNELQTVHLGR